ncbi:DUF4433 domain-containing protein [Achromobacter dolens]|uniref:type II toxin-antitoxin system toxin DNA ADP-ribosyl transferase DarT n=1 Tax=Achromobacter dolens TaxID=1287738 RepID=UPI0022B8AE1F|nr:DUF4433 domain-containing protein [Achromobacter dolens]MCZ8408144.1 DUF4433 domain-containing protein [Achromobacter dolens]
MPIPIPTRIFHITAIANLASIFQKGGLTCKLALDSSQQPYSNIAYQSVQARRATREVVVGPGGVVHDYVPFYFAPRSPMLRTIEGGNVQGCPWRQNDIVHLESTVQSVVNAELPFVFFDRNASLQYSRASANIADLETAVAWDLLQEAPALDGFCKYWNSISGHPRYSERMEYRQAEFLVHRWFPLEHVTKIGVANAQAQASVQQLLQTYGIKMQVAVKPEWYF